MRPGQTFADWQWSRGILPWTFVHDWSETQYLTRLMKRDMTKLIRTLSGPLINAFRKAAEDIEAFAAAFNEAGEA